MTGFQDLQRSAVVDSQDFSNPFSGANKKILSIRDGGPLQILKSCQKKSCHKNHFVTKYFRFKKPIEIRSTSTKK